MGGRSIMKVTFHKNVTIHRVPIQTLFGEVDIAGSTNSIGRGDVLEVNNDIAGIKLTMGNYFRANYVDLHMKFEDG